ncbi:hypothetical protein EJ903_25725 [Azospirillum griseum]|uniref:Phytanoyl-CoA dioxygenase family protein n=2 Tax=Azospirillum griseum TaxID=2496639 RepID=A0A431V9L3_9PROT|nr:hypothetical protein EJ903_25725 [Azospirillum griseum]
MNIRKDIDGDLGFSTEMSLTLDELTFVRECVSISLCREIRTESEEIASQAMSLGITHYHCLTLPFHHGDFWVKTRRLLPFAAVGHIRSMSFFKKLEQEFGPLRISNEEELMPEEVTWRLVRPGCAEDVGTVHADSWFWALGHGRMPAGYRRFKIWIPLHTEPGRNGILCAPGTHRLPHPPYRVERRGGIMKPVLDVDPQSLGLRLLPLEPGSVFAFHDDLLHGGAVNTGMTCRISIEFTCLYEDSCGPVDEDRNTPNMGGSMMNGDRP